MEDEVYTVTPESFAGARTGQFFGYLDRVDDGVESDTMRFLEVVDSVATGRWLVLRRNKDNAFKPSLVAFADKPDRTPIGVGSAS